MNSVKNPNIKAVFFDIDGTLFSLKTKSIPESTQKAIKTLREKGIKVIVATGRSIKDLNHIQHIDFDGFLHLMGDIVRQSMGTLCIKKQFTLMISKT